MLLTIIGYVWLILSLLAFNSNEKDIAWYCVISANIYFSVSFVQ